MFAAPLVGENVFCVAGVRVLKKEEFVKNGAKLRLKRFEHLPATDAKTNELVPTVPGDNAVMLLCDIQEVLSCPVPET